MNSSNREGKRVPSSKKILEVLSLAASKGDIIAWILSENIKTESGTGINFSDFRFLHDIYQDNSPLLCCRKAAQVGFSTYEILKSLYEANSSGEDVIYVLPTADDVKQFSGGKTNRIISNNPCLKKWVKDKDSIEQKRVGKSTIYYRGSWTERAALMISAKKLIVDEYDRCKQEVVEQYDSRLQAAVSPKKAFFSNPSIPDFGIDKLYKQSDQKKWHILHACGNKFPMEERCVDYESKIYRCPFCKKEISDEERKRGEWQATSSGEWSGYWIPLWITPWTSAEKIAEYKKAKSGEYFCNFVAGMPYAGGGDKVPASTIFNCLSQDTNNHQERVIIGVDTGLPVHIVCANKDGYFYYDTLPLPPQDPYRELEKLLMRWKGSIVISDQGGDLTGIRILQAKYPGRVFLCWYRRDRKNLELIEWGVGQEYGKVYVDRNQMIQVFIGEMMDKRVKFQGTESEWQEYICHWLNIYRTWSENSLGIREFKWERSGPDHYVHASIYARVGLSKFQDAKAKIVGGGDGWGNIGKGRIVGDAGIPSNQVILGTSSDI